MAKQQPGSLSKQRYKKRALIVHPDKGGSKEAFDELNTTFQKLERLIEFGTEFEFDSLTEMSSSLNEMLNELKAHLERMNASFDRTEASLDRMTANLERRFDELHSTLHNGFFEINASLDRLHTTLDTSFSEIHASLDKLNASVGELHTSTEKLSATFDSLNDSVDKMAASTTNLHASIQRLDDKLNIDIPFYLGCYTVFLGSVVSLISGKHQPQNARPMGAFVFGAGLIVTGGYLVANSLFKKELPAPASENKEQRTELALLRTEPK